MTKQTQHTPGPWHAYATDERMTPCPEMPARWHVGAGAKYYHVAEIQNGAPGDTLETEEANARLIAAAPDLLEACITAMNVLSDEYQSGKMLKAAIAKATGQQFPASS